MSSALVWQVQKARLGALNHLVHRAAAAQTAAAGRHVPRQPFGPCAAHARLVWNAISWLCVPSSAVHACMRRPRFHAWCRPPSASSMAAAPRTAPAAPQQAPAPASQAFNPEATAAAASGSASRSSAQLSIGETATAAAVSLPASESAGLNLSRLPPAEHGAPDELPHGAASPRAQAVASRDDAAQVRGLGHACRAWWPPLPAWPGQWKAKWGVRAACPSAVGVATCVRHFPPGRRLRRARSRRASRHLAWQPSLMRTARSPPTSSPRGPSVRSGARALCAFPAGARPVPECSARLPGAAQAWCGATSCTTLVPARTQQEQQRQLSFADHGP